MDQKDERGLNVSSAIVASCPENSIHHFHVFVSWLTLPIARSVAKLTQRIDEVQAGVWGGDGQTRCGAGVDYLMKVMMLPITLNDSIHLQKTWSAAQIARISVHCLSCPSHSMKTV